MDSKKKKELKRLLDSLAEDISQAIAQESFHTWASRNKSDVVAEYTNKIEKLIDA